MNPFRNLNLILEKQRGSMREKTFDKAFLNWWDKNTFSNMTGWFAVKYITEKWNEEHVKSIDARLVEDALEKLVKQGWFRKSLERHISEVWEADPEIYFYERTKQRWMWV